jgi:hypothetical protein
MSHTHLHVFTSVALLQYMLLQDTDEVRRARQLLICLGARHGQYNADLADNNALEQALAQSPLLLQAATKVLFLCGAVRRPFVICRATPFVHSNQQICNVQLMQVSLDTARAQMYPCLL